MNNCTNGSSFSDQDRMEDLIAQEKFLIDGYSTFIPEASCPELRRVLSDNLSACFNDQYAVFEKMQQKGWYPGKEAAQTDVDQVRQKFAQLQQQMA